MLAIIHAPNPILSQTAKRVKKVEFQVKSLIKEMEETLNHTHDPQGVGLAAPQVGKSLQIFITKPSSKSKIQVFINPEIIQKTETSRLTVDNDHRSRLNKTAEKKLPARLEGCLSLQSIWGDVIRNRQVVVSYLDENGIPHKKKFSGFLATIIQHETDHLNGILFPKRVLEQKGKLYKSYKDEKGEDEFEEIKL
ncbi:MAG: peptide deformylase [Patescibacteria group bacterium]|nr:peptide deformylase [Patescibacteria group bacterium]